MSLVRLQKLLAAGGIGSRRHCEALITAGRVTVDGVTITELGARAAPAQRIEVDGAPLALQTRQTYLADKPRGILCTSSDPKKRRTIIEWARDNGIPAGLRLYTVGRLDYDSEGLILLTNDGDLANTLAHPRHEVEKEYRAWTDRYATPAQLDALAAGVQSEGETLRAQSVAAEPSRPGKAPALRVILNEGRNRHVRRMLEAVGLNITRLRRIRIGPLTESDLRGKPLRQLTPDEIRRLRPR